MLKLHRPLCPDVTFRLTHDISPDIIYEDDGTGDGDYCDFNDFKLKEFWSDNYGLDRKAPATNPQHRETLQDKNAKNLYNRANHDSMVADTSRLIIREDPPTPHKAGGQAAGGERGRTPLCPAAGAVGDHESEEPTGAAGEDGAKGGPGATTANNCFRLPRRPRRLPDIPKQPRQRLDSGGGGPQALPGVGSGVKTLADELREALERQEDDVFLAASHDTFLQYAGICVDRSNQGRRSRQPSTSESSACLGIEDSGARRPSPPSTTASRRGSSSDEEAKAGGRAGAEGRQRTGTASFLCSAMLEELEVTHRGMHRFLPRHEDEMAIEIGDPIHVIAEEDDLWCEGINLRSGQKGIFPGMYATDLNFLEEDSDEDEDESKFSLSYLGSVEVSQHKGDEVLCQAVNKVALQRKATMNKVPPPLCTLEINQYGIRMMDRSKDGVCDSDVLLSAAHESDKFSHFFALRNISFCGSHPRNNRYFGFITKHPSDRRFACHVFLGDKSTQSVTDALADSFKRFYQEYMAMTHPTEDIYLE